jgi:plasmid replication initiation protein
MYLSLSLSSEQSIVTSLSTPQKKRFFMNKSLQALVVQSNKLIEARYQITVQEQRLLFAMISMIELTDEDFKFYSFRLTELAALWEIDQDVVYRDAKKITAKLLTRVLHITETDGSLLQINWVCTAMYKSGYLNLQFHPLLKPYLLQLKGAFTKCKLLVLNQFESIYSIRIYQLLQQYRSIGSRTFEIEELRNILGIGADQYPVFQDFKRRVLLQARKELDLKGDMSFDIEGNAKGKKTTAITLKIIEKNAASPDKKTAKAAESNQQAGKTETPAAVPVPTRAARINRFPFEHDEAFGAWLAQKGLTVDLLQWAESGQNSFICKASYNDFLRERENGRS